MGKLSDREIKDRLRLFLNRSLDDSLESKKIHGDAALRAFAQSLIKNEKFDRFIKDLTDNWLDLRNIDFTSPDRTLFPEFDNYLKYSMLKETRSFVRRMFLENLPISNLVKSDFAMINERLAQHYGIENVIGAKFRSVSLPPNSPRGGLLTQGSILKVTANGTNTSPVMRGVWVMERILGQVPTPPPLVFPVWSLIFGVLKHYAICLKSTGRWKAVRVATPSLTLWVLLWNRLIPLADIVSIIAR